MICSESQVYDPYTNSTWTKTSWALNSKDEANVTEVTVKRMMAITGDRDGSDTKNGLFKYNYDTFGPLTN